jgi:diguanylate cyclase (GGDEF)-like protein
MSSRPPDDDLDRTRVSSLTELQRDRLEQISRDRAYLTVLAGSNVGEMYRLEGDETVIGRANGVHIRLNDDGISRRHARVYRQGSQILIEDLKSANGTMVNGEAVMRHALQDGDKVRLGTTTILKFAYNDQLDEHFQQRMYDAALRDGLTKAFNRKYFLDRLETELAYARRHNAALSLLMFDVDHFKRVNDTFGHLAGDYVLAALAEIATQTIRTEDVFARYGGEEFAVVCRSVPLGNAGILGERLRSAVNGFTFQFEGKRIPITISVGVAAHPDLPIETPSQLIAAADEALYEAKRGGRNRVLLKHGAAG